MIEVEWAILNRRILTIYLDHLKVPFKTASYIFDYNVNEFLYFRVHACLRCKIIIYFNRKNNILSRKSLACFRGKKVCFAFCILSCLTCVCWQIAGYVFVYKSCQKKMLWNLACLTALFSQMNLLWLNVVKTKGKDGMRSSTGCGDETVAAAAGMQGLMLFMLLFMLLWDGPPAFLVRRRLNPP